MLYGLNFQFRKNFCSFSQIHEIVLQEVLKELVARRLPNLAAHLERCDIDLATVTLNWFLALFYDAVPFQVLLCELFKLTVLTSE